MRKLVVLVAVAALGLILTVPTAAEAQFVKGQFLAGPGAGIALPIGDFGDAAKLGFGVGAVGDYFMTEKVAIGADIVYNFLKAKELDGTEEAGVDTDWKLLQITAHAKYFFSQEGSSLTPYVFGGAGFYNMKASASGEVEGINLSVSASSTDFGINGGGGVMFKAGEKMKVGAQAAFHNIFSEGSSAQYVSAGAFLLFSFGAK